MATACQGSCTGYKGLPGSLGGRGRLAARLPLRRANSGLSRISCSAAGDVAAAPSISGQASGPPPSWPSAAARQAGYSTTSRQPAVDVPAGVSGRLPEWLNGTYIRNGPGDLQPMEHMFDGYAMLSSFKLDGRSNSASGSHRHAERPRRPASWQCSPPQWV